MSDAELHRKLDGLRRRLDIVIVLLVVPYLFALASLFAGSLSRVVVIVMSGLVVAGFVFLWLVFRPQVRSRG